MTITARTDSEKAAEQTRISLEYQLNTQRRRQQHHGVVVTPIEVTDFIIRSLVHQLKTERGRDPDQGIEWLDPFAGTGIFTARLLQIVELSPERKRDLAENCIAVEIDPDAAQTCFDNLARVHHEETGHRGFIRVICADTFALDPDYDLWSDDYGHPGVIHLPTKH